jgi:DNA repair exonuclease SbcCD ATPase subunit
VAAIEDTSYPLALQRLDRLRGQRDGEKRTPALAEVRRREREMKATGEQLTVGYQVVLLAELDAELNALFPAYQRAGQSMRRDISRHHDRIADTEEDLRRAEERLEKAAAALTPEELRPGSPQEERWDEQTLRNRREVARARRIRRAQEAVEALREQLKQRHAECAEAERRREEALTNFGNQARRLKEIYQRRMATYVDALTRSHPDGKTLNALLSMPDIPLPQWVPNIVIPDELNTTAEVKGEHDQPTPLGTQADRDNAEGPEQKTGPEHEQ